MSIFFYAFCEDCGAEVRPCQLCQKTSSCGLSNYCNDCKEMTCCSHAIQHYQDDPTIKAVFLCNNCEYARDQASAEVWSYWYWPADRDEPLSPTNVYRIPRFRPVSEGPTDPVERADEALAAYNIEMKFSGNEDEALKIYVSFYNRGSPNPKAKKQIREGFVSMREILAGQPVTGEQFFQSLKFPDREPKEDDSYVGNNPKTMTKAQLRRAIEKAEDDRQLVLGRLRGHPMSWEDQNHILMMREWSTRLWAEMKTR